MGTSPQHHASYRRLRVQMKAMRNHAELTQRALAAKLKKPHSYVAKVEHGDRRIDPVEFVKWCKACGFDPSEAIREVK